MDHSLDSSRTPPSDPTDQPLLRELEQLSPALAGFPVDQLLHAFMSAEQRDRADAYRLVDRCLVNWIASLDVALGDYPEGADEALARVQTRQRGTRDALVRLKGVLSQAEVVRGNRGQLC